MKELILSSLFLLYTWTNLANNPTLDTQQVDSLLFYRQLSGSKELSFDKRLHAIDQAIRLSSNKSDSTYLSQVSYKSTIYGASKDYDNAITETERLLKEAKRLDQIYFIALSYEKLGRYLGKKRNDVGAFKNYIRAIELYTELNDSINIIKVSKRASFIQSQIGDLDGAEFTIVNALDYSSALDDISELSWFYDVLGRVYRERSLWQESIRNHRKALQLETSPKSRVALINNYAITLIKSDRFNEAIVQLETALEYDDSELQPRLKYRLLDNLAFAKAKLGNPEAIQLLEKALVLRKDANDITGQYASHIHLSEAYGSIDNNKIKAAFHAQRAYSIATQLKNTEAIVRSLDFLIPVTRKSNTLFEQRRKLSDSLTSAQNKAKFEFAKLRYDVEKAEEREITALRLQSASESREGIAIKKRDWAFAGLFMFLAIALTFIILQRESARKQRLLDRYNTEKRIAKKLHDELANEVYLVMTHLERDKTTPAIADKLEHIYKLSRDISRETQPIQTGDTFPDELSLNLQTYTSAERKLILKGLESIQWKIVKPEKKIEIYRVLQELMTNMRKHSKASLVALVFKEADNILEINYSDNGRGTTLSTDNSGSGLTNAETRLKAIEGHITFDSAINEGFRAALSIPL